MDYPLLFDRYPGGILLTMDDGLPKLVPIKRIDVFRSVLEQLEGMIEGGMQAGARLPSDRDLATRLGVSRPVVRQALKVLEGLGKVETKPGSGTYVTGSSHLAAKNLLIGVPVEDRTLEMLLPARRAIEVEIIRLAFENKNEENIAVLEECLRASAPTAAHGGRSTEGLDLRFEKGLGQICGNQALQKLQDAVHESWVQTEVSLGMAPGTSEVLHAEHTAIFERYREGDLEGAIAAYLDHMSFSS